MEKTVNIRKAFVSQNNINNENRTQNFRLKAFFGAFGEMDFLRILPIIINKFVSSADDNLFTTRAITWLKGTPH